MRRWGGVCIEFNNSAQLFCFIAFFGDFPADVVERFQLLLFLSLILFQDVDSWDALNNFGTTAVRTVFLHC
jgi:hypothetical protein